MGDRALPLEETAMLEFVWLIPLFPAIGFVINGLFGRQINRKAVGLVACAAIGLSAVFSSVLFFVLLKQPDYFFKGDLQLDCLWAVRGGRRLPGGCPLYRDGPCGLVGEFLHPCLFHWIYA